MFFIVNLSNLTVPNLAKLAEELGIKLNGKLKADKIKEIQSAGIEEKRLEALIYKYSKSNKSTQKKKPTDSGSTGISKRIEVLEVQVRTIMTKISNIESSLTQFRSGITSAPITTSNVSSDHFLRIIQNVFSSMKKSSGGFVPIPSLTKGIKEYIPWSTKKIHDGLYKLFSEYKIELQPGKSKEGEPLEQDGQKFYWFKLR